MGQDDRETRLNLGCGFRKLEGYINVDAYENCAPDVLWDLNTYPWPWEDNSVDHILGMQLFEHLDDWWKAFRECARILKRGGILEMYVPDHTSTDALAYRDHHHIIHVHSFHGILEAPQRGANAWAWAQERVPFRMISYIRIPLGKYQKWWIPKWLLKFCLNHMVNFGAEQRFTFQKG